MTILIVDDEANYRLLVRSILMEKGIEVATAANGEDALERLAAGDITMVISDLYMPVMDGIKFHRAVRGTPGLEKLPFLFVSAVDDMYTREAVKDLRCDAFLCKTNPTSDLIAWVRYLSTPEGNRRGGVPGTGRNAKETRSRETERVSTRVFIA